MTRCDACGDWVHLGVVPHVCPPVLMVRLDCESVGSGVAVRAWCAESAAVKFAESYDIGQRIARTGAALVVRVSLPGGDSDWVYVVRGQLHPMYFAREVSGGV